METGILNPEGRIPLQDYLTRLQLKALDTRIAAVETQLRAAEGQTDPMALMAEHKDLTRQRKELFAGRHGPHETATPLTTKRLSFPSISRRFH